MIITAPHGPTSDELMAVESQAANEWETGMETLKQEWRQRAMTLGTDGRSLFVRTRGQQLLAAKKPAPTTFAAPPRTPAHTATASTSTVRPGDERTLTTPKELDQMAERQAEKEWDNSVTVREKFAKVPPPIPYDTRPARDRYIASRRMELCNDARQGRTTLAGV